MFMESQILNTFSSNEHRGTYGCQLLSPWRFDGEAWESSIYRGEEPWLGPMPCRATSKAAIFLRSCGINVLNVNM